MATSEQEAQARNALQTSLAELRAIKVEDLIREDDLGRLSSFAPGVPAFERLLNLYSVLGESSLDAFPLPVLNQLQDSAQNAIRTFNQVKAFRPDQGSSARDQIIQSVQNLYDTHFQQLAPYLAYSARRDTDFAELERKARESVRRVDEVLADQKEAVAKGLAEMETALRSVREAAAEAGVAQHAINFRTAAEEHRTGADKWLRGTMATGVIGVLLVIVFFIWPLHPETSFTNATTPQAIYAVASRLLVFSIIYFALLWAGRNYMAHRHNYIVNKHRQNALATFREFVAGAGEDKDVKNAILLQASSSIFTAQPSGYYSKQQVQPPPTNLVEVIKSVHTAAED